MPPDPKWVGPPHGLAAVRATFGAITVEGGQVTTPGWESRNMVVCGGSDPAFPAFPGVPHKLYVNRAIVAPLREALARCLALCDGYTVKTIGCFSPRAKRVSDQLSLHSWGIAVDINAYANPLAPAGVILEHAERDIPDAWVKVYEDLGWTWGGHFRRPDPMHFQWASGV